MYTHISLNLNDLNRDENYFFSSYICHHFIYSNISQNDIHLFLFYRHWIHYEMINISSIGSYLYIKDN